MTDGLTSSDASSLQSAVVDLNVGGVHYSTTLGTLTKRLDSRLARLAMAFISADDSVRLPAGGAASTSPSAARDRRGRCFIDRDGLLFRYVLDFIRTGILVLPDGFPERDRLRQEAEFFELEDMVAALTTTVNGKASISRYVDRAANPAAFGLTGDRVMNREPGYITIGYRGTFGCGRADGAGSEIRFRKVSRILVSGRVSLCRQVFGDTLNDSRNPDRGPDDHYSSRFYLKHAFIEQAFDALLAAGFQLVAACGTGTNSGSASSRVGGDLKPGGDSEEARWNHYNEFVFCRQ